MILFLDTETTGLISKSEIHDSEDQPHILQLAFEVTDFEGNTLFEVDQICKPEVEYEISEKALSIHGITKEKVNKKGRSIIPYVGLLFSIMPHTKIVGHNVDFDIKMLQIEAFRYRVSTYYDPTYFDKFDTMKQGKKYISLSDLYKELFNTSFYGQHNAKYDVNATKKCYFEMIK